MARISRLIQLRPASTLRDACEECVVVEPDDADVDEGDGEGTVVGPPFEQAPPELGLVDRRPVDLENEEGDRDRDDGVAEGLDASAMRDPADRALWV